MSRFKQFRGQVFHGWWMVASGFGNQLLVGALFNQAYGAYVVLLREEFGWSKTALSAAYSMTRFENGMLGPFEGWLIDRFGPRVIIQIGTVIFAIGLMLLSQVHSLFMFYVAFFVASLGSSLGGFLPLNVAVVNWFRRRRATALAVMQTGFAVGGFLVPVVVLFLEGYGWRETAFGSGVLVLVIGLPLASVIRHRPEQYGEQVDGNAVVAAEAANATVSVDDDIDFTATEALKTRAFWMISFGHGAALLVVSAVLVHLVSHLNENLGYSLGTASLVILLMTVMQMVGQVSGGYLGDRISKRKIVVICMGMHMAGLLLVAYATSLAMVIGFAVLHGLAWGTRGPLMQAMRADYFGRGSFGVIMGLSSMITMLGNTGGPLIAGILADQTGSYETGFTVLAVLAGLGSIFFMLAVRPRPPQRGSEQSPLTSISLSRDPA